MNEQETILIADGDPLGRETLKALLMSQGYNLTFATSGPDTLIKIEEIEPDLLLLDAVLPEINGFEVCEKLRTDLKITDIPIIMVTALDDDASRLRGLRVGVDDFITKPFDMAQLRARVRTITNLNRQRRLRTLELQAERDRNQAILEALGDAVVVADMAGIIQYVNPATITLTGFDREEAIGQHWGLLHHQATSNKLSEILDVVKQGKTWRGEVVGRHKDNKFYDAALTVAPLFASTQPHHLVGFVSVQRDVTVLKEAQRAKDIFVSNVSHELRTPLSVITLVGDNLDGLYDRLNDDQRRKLIRDIQKHSQTLDELIDDVLQLSYIDSHRISLEQEQLDLAQLLQEEAEKLHPLAWEKDLRLEIYTTDQVLVWGNPGQLRRVIRNLINNAIKYTANGGEIICECAALGHTPSPDLQDWPNHKILGKGYWGAVKITDNGIGIDQQHLPHVFERFYRVKAEQTIRGSGLGLAITRELIELHNGKVAVTSTLNEGSSFAFYLPLEAN